MQEFTPLKSSARNESNSTKVITFFIGFIALCTIIIGVTTTNHQNTTTTTTTTSANLNYNNDVVMGQESRVVHVDLSAKIPTKPTSPGCFVFTPWGCPKRKNSWNASNEWKRDTHGEKYYNAKNSPGACLITRKKAYISWCGVKNIMMHFVPKPHHQIINKYKNIPPQNIPPKPKPHHQITTVTQPKLPITAWPVCWINSYGRGVGEPLSTCPSGYEKKDLLCYKHCKNGYYGVGPVCYQKCPPGWKDHGVFCTGRRLLIKPSDNSACPWWDKCGLWHRNKGCSNCKKYPGFHNDGCTCRRHEHITKQSYGRGVGKAMMCRHGFERKGGLCYPVCKNNHRGEGLICWGSCPSSHPYKCGDLMCTVNKKACANKIGNIAKSLILKQGVPFFTSVVSELCIPKCGDQRHMACTVMDEINNAASICPLDIRKCANAAKCFKFLGNRIVSFVEGASKFLSGGSLKDFASFFKKEDGIKSCIKASGQWFRKNPNGCDVDKDGNFKTFAKCIAPQMLNEFVIKDLASPALYVSIGIGANAFYIGSDISFDIYFGFDGTIMFSYTRCTTLTTPDISGGVSIAIGLQGNKDVAGEGYSLGIGAGIPVGVGIGAGAEIGYSEDGKHVTNVGINLSVTASIDLLPVAASCSHCNTRVLGCVTTLEEIGLGDIMSKMPLVDRRRRR